MGRGPRPVGFGRVIRNRLSTYADGCVLIDLADAVNIAYLRARAALDLRRFSRDMSRLQPPDLRMPGSHIGIFRAARLRRNWV